MTNPVELGFPKPRNAVRGRWRPLYIEPILGSGERFAIGVVAVSLDGAEHVVLSAPGISRLYCVFDDNAELLLYVARKALDYLSQDLGSRGMEAFLAPKRNFMGIKFGDIAVGAGNSLTEVAETGLRSCSSLGNPPISEMLDDVAPVKGWREPRLNALLKEYVSNVDKKYMACFDVPFTARQDGAEKKRRIGFVGARVVSNFYAINGSQPRRSEKPIQSAVLNLVVHRDLQKDAMAGMWRSEIPNYAMMVLRPEDNGMWSGMQLESVEELCEDLAADCRVEGIDFIPQFAVQPLGDYLISVEKGAPIPLN